jgi:hypothetical protein
MENYLKRVQKKKEKVDQKKYIKRDKSKSLSDQLHAGEESTSQVTETPFRPPVDKHIALLAQARSDEEKASQVLHLQRTYGNRYVDSLLNSATTQPKLNVNPSDDKYQPKMGYLRQMAATEPIEEEEMMIEGRAAATEPIEEEEMMVESRDTMASYPGMVSANQNLSPVLVPVNPARAGATVIVKDKKFDIWINPAASKCVVEGMRLHEQKHIDDFNADPNYKDIPTKGLTWEGPVKGLVPDGETFYYRNDEDAKKFEHAAIDLEIEWLNKELEDIYELSDSDRKIITRRATKTLPEYRKSFG